MAPASPRPIHISPVKTESDLSAVRQLFEAYARSLTVDLCYQGFPEELAGLPGRYSPPGGALLLARDTADRALGCVALRPLSPPVCCEMKRLYVAPEGRGLGLGKALVQAVMTEAKQLGYREVRLDTLPDMTEAIALYRQLGFQSIAPYYDTPVAGTLFLGRSLSS
jgi:ribosomal protein S18 acetylase RimI-like enzyme